MGYYKFKPDDAVAFARYLGQKFFTKNDELVFETCPYCKNKHKDNKNKFAINLQTGQFNCFRSSCGAKGNMLTLAKDFNFSLGTDVDEYYDRNPQQYRTFKLNHIESKDAAVRYCQSRGISEEICKRYELTVQKEHENILVFPFRDDKGVVCFIKYRKTDYDKEKDRNKEWAEKNGKAILFGMSQCDLSNDTLVITEGQMDSLSVAQAGIPNAVSVPTGAKGQTWIPHCWDWLQNFTELIIFGDCEKGHITLVDMLKGRFRGKVKVVRECDYKGCKDANEILTIYGEDAIRTAIENAEIIPEVTIRSMASVERVNILEMDAIKTGITKLDEVLKKGIYFGQVILLTGARGDGKSTFMNQLICNAVDEGINCFVYSGELPNYVVRNFTDTMFAGQHETAIPSYLSEKIADWYKDKLFVYDNTVIETDETVDLLKIVEKAITQYGCRLICLDNLMTIVEAVNNDALYRAQSQFVGTLAKMAKKYNVAFILVAHPRKKSGNNTSEFSSDDVSGSADITNKVDVVMSYQRKKAKLGEEADNSIRELWITKNRLTGQLAIGKEAIILKYNPSDRRIVGEEQKFDRQYGWDKGEGFKHVDDNDLPF